jgi:hypothetical protein
VSEIATIPQRREIQSVVDPVPVLDTSRFEHMQRVANIIARSSMVPETLRTEGTRDNKVALPFEQVMANCFLVVNQSVRWGLDPFAVIACCSMVHGRLAYEGKLVAAVIDAKVGVKLHHYFTGEATSEAYRIYLSDQPFEQALIEQLKPGLKVPGLRLWDGSVAEWKTTGTGTPWTPKNYPRMLIYRGTRDWTRIYEPAVLLGVYTDDELMDLAEDARARRATTVSPVTLADRLAAAKSSVAGQDGFNHDHVTRETEVQREAAGTDSPPPPASMASAQEPDASGSEGVQDRCESTPSPVSNSADPPSQAQPDTPAGVASSPQPPAGTQSEDSPAGRASGEGGGDDAAGEAQEASSPPLPEGWARDYAAALRRAQKKESLPKYASQFWDMHGGWDAHKSGVNGPTAAAIFDAFKKNFGDKDAIEAELRELT